MRFSSARRLKNEGMLTMAARYSINYLWTTAVKSSSGNLFEDKPSLAVDIPRAGSGYCVVPALPLRDTQIFRAGTVYVAWTEFTGTGDDSPAQIMFSESTNCGLTWSRPQQISNYCSVDGSVPRRDLGAVRRIGNHGIYLPTKGINNISAVAAVEGGIPNDFSLH